MICQTCKDLRLFDVTKEKKVSNKRRKMSFLLVISEDKSGICRFSELYEFLSADVRQMLYRYFFYANGREWKRKLDVNTFFIV